MSDKVQFIGINAVIFITILPKIQPVWELVLVRLVGFQYFLLLALHPGGCDLLHKAVGHIVRQRGIGGDVKEAQVEFLVALVDPSLELVARGALLMGNT
jgi:hypothetical protein